MKIEYYYVLGIGMLLSFLLPAGYFLGLQQQASAQVQNVSFILGGLELWNLTPNNYTFKVDLVNPYSFPVKLQWVLESEIIEYSCSLKDGSIIEPNSNVTSTVDLTVLRAHTGIFKLHARGVQP